MYLVRDLKSIKDALDEAFKGESNEAFGKAFLSESTAFSS
jgi:uncharacterized protein YukE